MRKGIVGNSLELAVVVSRRCLAFPICDEKVVKNTERENSSRTSCCCRIISQVEKLLVLRGGIRTSAKNNGQLVNAASVHEYNHPSSDIVGGMVN